mmetsp:Transcript_6015/g.14576  ORF Transcript_6015/g.14576 Transcript_6015/m.14576 type:complete len:268 (+) Transcript_6015:15-818(+)
MELLLLVQPEFKEDMEAALATNNVDLNNVHTNADFSQPQEKAQFIKYQILVDPSLYRILNDAMQQMPGARIEIVNQVVTKQGDIDLEVEVGQKSNMIAATSDESAGFATQRIPSHTNTFISHDYDNDDNDDDNDDSGFGDSGAGRRKAQKKNKKKNRKQQRRAAESNDAQVESLGQSLSSQLKVDGTNTPAASAASANTSSSNSADGRKSCNTCGGFFDSPAEFRAHFKSDWHRFNQKLKMKGCTPVSEKEFLMCDSDTFFTGDSIL